MKKKLLIVLVLIIALGSNTFASQEKVLKLEDVSNNIEKSSTLKLFDVAYNKLVNAKNKMFYRYVEISFAERDTNASFAGIILMNRNKDRNLIIYHENKPIYVYYPYSYYLNGRDTNQSITLIPYRIPSQLKLTPINKTVTKNSLNIGAATLYYNILLLEQNINMQQELADAMKAQFDKVDQKYKNGSESQKEYEKSKIEYEKAAEKVNSLQKSKENLVFALNKIMTVPINTSYDKFSEEIKYTKKDINLEESINKALANRYEVLSAKEDVDYKTTEYNLAKRYKTNNTYIKYELVEKQKEQAELKLETAIEDIKQEITYAYETINNNYEKILNDEIDYKSAQNKYKNMEDRYEAGLITADILNLSHVEVTGAKLKMLGDINNYNLSLKKLEAAIGAGPKFN